MSVLRRYAPAIGVLAVLVVVGGVGRALGPPSSPGAESTSATRLPVTFLQAQASHRRLDFGPGCDPATGRIRVPTFYAPPCVVPFSGDNGGATAPGVTRDTITVAVYRAAPSLLTQGVLAGGGSSDSAESVMRTISDYVVYFERHYQTYGRHVRLVAVEASGGDSDDAGAKADAIRVATEIKAFASFGGPTMTNAYALELAARHVLCLGCTTGLTGADIGRAAPYVWGMQPTPEEANVQTAEFVGTRLAGGPARFAGDPGLRGRPRAFGLMAYDPPNGSFAGVREDLARNLSRYGVRLAAVATYTLDVSRAQELARTLVTRLKSAGVTSVLFDGDPFAPAFLTAEATKQRWFPEWIVTGSAFTDTSAFARLYDPAQWAHAFGVSELPGRLAEPRSEAYRLHAWEFGTPPPAGSTYPLVFPDPFILFTAVHLAGPRLTPATFRDALFSYPPSGGGPTTARIAWGASSAPSGSASPPSGAEYVGFRDATEIWWDPTAAGPDEIGRNGNGLYRYVDGGLRHLPGQWPPTGAPPFSSGGAVAIFDPPPDRPPDYPRP